MRTIVLRGPGGAGKTTLGEALRAEFGYPSALIDTDMFSWTTVPGESNKRVVFEAVRSVAEIYIRNGYDVIVSGLILTDPSQILCPMSSDSRTTASRIPLPSDGSRAGARSAIDNRYVAVAQLEQSTATASAAQT